MMFQKIEINFSKKFKKSKSKNHVRKLFKYQRSLTVEIDDNVVLLVFFLTSPHYIGFIAAPNNHIGQQLAKNEEKIFCLLAVVINTYIAC